MADVFSDIFVVVFRFIKEHYWLAIASLLAFLTVVFLFILFARKKEKYKDIDDN
jgi:hypothetical protein